jgi:midasin
MPYQIATTMNDTTRLVWTLQAVRMASLVLHSFKFREPVLLIGETGCGKTSVCQAVTEQVLKQTLVTVNCHLNTEASDFLGGLRPCRDRGEGEEEDGRDGQKEI